MKTSIIFSILLFSSLFVNAQKSTAILASHKAVLSNLDGTYTITDETNKRKVMHFENGVLHGELLVYGKSNILLEKQNYLHGERHGYWTFWNKAGKKTAVIQYSKGLKEGKWELFNKNGSRKAIMFYKAGLKTGIWRSYDLEGNLIDERNYNLEVAAK